MDGALLGGEKKSGAQPYVLGGVGQLLFDPLHDLPEGRPVEGVGLPAGPHDPIPAAWKRTRFHRFSGPQINDVVFVIPGV